MTTKRHILQENNLPQHSWKALRFLAHLPMKEFQERLDEIVKQLRYAPNRYEVFHSEKDGQWYIFLDYGASILGVAHLDCVVAHQPQNYFMNIMRQNAFTNAEEEIIFTPFLDDRLGVYVLLFYLQQAFEGGLPYDILLTIDEESGRSSARKFKLENHDLPVGRYRWGFEFDATAGDVAKTYSYGDTEWHKVLEDEGWRTEYGSYTDICYLQQLGVKMVNISCGYYKYHNVDSYFKVSELDTALVRFLSFYEKHKDTTFPHTEKVYSSGAGYGRWGADEWNEEDWYAGRYYSGGTSASTKGSSTWKQNPYKDGRPMNFNWMREVDHLQTWCEYARYCDPKAGGAAVEVNFSVHFESGAEAAKCHLCKVPHWVEELNFDNGWPICVACNDLVASSGLVDFDDWMVEGGIVAADVKEGKTLFTRKVLPQDTNHTYLCSRCKQPDWKEPYQGLHNGLCRWCAEAGEKKDKRATQPINPVSPTRPLLPSVSQTSVTGTHYSLNDTCFCGKKGTHYSGSTDTWYCDEHYPHTSSKIVTPNNTGKPQRRRKNKGRFYNDKGKK